MLYDVHWQRLAFQIFRKRNIRGAIRRRDGMYGGQGGKRNRKRANIETNHAMA